MSECNKDEIIRGAVGDADIRGFVSTDKGWMLDRRYTNEAISQYGLSPRTADLNIAGLDLLPVPEYLEVEIGL